MDIKSDKGLTLVVLIVTLIVMMILTSIFIASAIDDGTIRNAENVVELNNEVINKTVQDEKNILVKNVVQYDVKE